MPFPLIGGLIAKGVGTLVKKNAGGLARAAGRLAGKVARKPIVKIAGGTAVGAAAFEGGSRVARGAFGDGERRKYRRTNVGNIKALRRAMRRVEGFAKLAKSTISFTKSTRMKKRGRR